MNQDICPKCGCISGKNTDPTHCWYCNTQMVETDIDINDFLTLYLEIKGIQLERTLQQLYRKYVYNSPEFDEELFNQRQMKDDMENAKIEKNDREREANINTPKCPQCGSTAITAGQRGFNIWTGFFGSGSTVNRCANCGYKWKP